MRIDPDRVVLPSSEMLAGYEKEDLEELSDYGRFIIFNAGDVIIREGHEQNRLGFLIAGALDVVHETETGPVPVGTISEGEWFGEINIFDADVASATVISRGESQVWYISRAKLEEFLNTSPALGCQLILGAAEVLARRIRRVLAKLNATWELSS
jgi:CRP-like cAMP-binding protein